MTKREFLDTVFALAPNEANAIMDAFDEYVESTEPHWIPVTERPKEEEKSYWVCLEDGGQCQCRWTNDIYGLGANEWSKWRGCTIKDLLDSQPTIQPDNGLQKLADEIASFKRHVKSDNSDYITGYLCALSVVEGMIADIREVTE